MTTTPRHATPIKARDLSAGDVLYRVHVKQLDEPVTVTDAHPQGRYGAVRVMGTTPSDPVSRVRFQAIGPVTTVVAVVASPDRAGLTYAQRTLVDQARSLLDGGMPAPEYVSAVVDLVALHVYGAVHHRAATLALLGFETP